MTIQEIILNDSRLLVDVVEACTKFDVDLSSSGQTEISMEFADPKFALLGANVFQRKMPFQWRDLKCEIAVIEAGDKPKPMGVTIKARSFGVQKFKRTKDAVVRRNISPTDWLITEARLVGATVVGQTSSKKPQIARVNTENEQQSTWDVLSQLAGELGYLFFECAGVFYFGQPSWLIKRPGVRTWTMAWNPTDDVQASTSTPSILSVPQCRMSENAKEASSIDLLVDRTLGVNVRPGDAVNFSGVPMFNGLYMVEGVSWSELSPSEPVSITLTTPIDPEKTGKNVQKQRAVTEKDGPALLINATALQEWEASS